MSKKRSDERDWQAIRRAWEVGDKPVAQIAQAFGVHRDTIYRRAKVWRQDAADQTSQKETQKQPRRASARGQKTKAASAEAQDHLTMVQRLFNATDQQIRHLEQQHESGEAAFDEKEARMLGTIARTLDKIMDLTSQKPAESDGDGESVKSNKAGDKVNERSEEQLDLDRLRQDLAQRLDRLQQSGSGPISGEPVD
ncbi:hypothetical protein [Cohaesibacter intestini]|uniref:hypothetical protein n=1 Tax=Cohaesibacter intestini TaxID=2211145 RepID=UPI0013008BD0|nr:hypothetical protein [Cohaesibacter intestini]